ncbi:hypothetical protein QQ045_012321 [Rhodiola kirilowii]
MVGKDVSECLQIAMAKICLDMQVAALECEDEEELEWLSNKDAFPSVDTFVPSYETFVNMIPVEYTTTALKHESPVSVLENNNSSFGSNDSNNSNAVITSYYSGQGLAPPIRCPRSKASLDLKSHIFRIETLF